MFSNKNKKTLLITGAVIFSLGISGMTFADIYSKRKVAEEKERLRLEEIERIKNEPIIGAKKESKQKHGYNAKDIETKLSNYDYDNNGEKIVFLTFDDGPSTTNTPEVLNILKKHDVKATFFIKGSSLESEGADKILKRTFDEGHSIAHHSYSHDYSHLYPNRSLNLDNFVGELEKTDAVFKEVLGEKFSTNVVRCPGGHMSWKNMDELDVYLDNNNMVSIDWNALNADAEGPKKDAEGLYNHAVKTSEGKEIVVLLMHDMYGKENTVNSLDKLINYYKENGYSFKMLV